MRCPYLTVPWALKVEIRSLNRSAVTCMLSTTKPMSLMLFVLKSNSHFPSESLVNEKDSEGGGKCRSSYVNLRGLIPAPNKGPITVGTVQSGAQEGRVKFRPCFGSDLSPMLRNSSEFDCS